MLVPSAVEIGARLSTSTEAGAGDACCWDGNGMFRENIKEKVILGWVL